MLGRKGKHEELQVACRNITSTCAHLAALSKTKGGTGGADEGAQQQVRIQMIVSHYAPGMFERDRRCC